MTIEEKTVGEDTIIKTYEDVMDTIDYTAANGTSITGLTALEASDMILLKNH